MSGANTKHDDTLFEMLKECKTLPNFLDAIFGFLNRRTDFYHIASDPKAAVGLPEGLAEKIAQSAFFKWKMKPPETVRPDDIPADGEEVIISDEVMEEAANSSEDKQTAPKLPINSDCQFSKSDYYNGAAFDNYCWSQTITDVDVIVKLPENVSRKDLNVNIQTSKITVKHKENTTLLSGEFCQKCKANDAIWSVDNGKLIIHLDKSKEMWWNCLLKSEPEIDISQIDCSRPYEELPEDAQAKIEELQWNQERKRLGLPTSEEMAMHKTLEKAWNAEGSPFNGPFDPSKVQFS
ncbi:unnamed protein product [Acanthoscelides obtectus]|uniref:Nuclear migration protein nudC n=1 Tax=Acanthoscelides obtectus TaxID=200917 RepID=A0A9P0KZN8_ACAOB|nr:unnamed protein product [Acanthoscelides obtectus]CAK1630042.1 NudC domain-containing protein 3 [Acanthoscelides obtectus]